ncbi:MAG TPA: phosphoglucosamine mutase [Acidimicrobiales bacterium]
MALQVGTDGVRGAANTELTPEIALALGRAAARVLGDSFVVGTDTRRSGPLLQAALCAGLASEGADVVLLGVVPTPAVAYASQTMVRAGAMVSASHNPFEDNGIKLFAPGGLKLSDDVEERIESEIRHLSAGDPPVRTGADVGRIGPAPSGVVDAYVSHVLGAAGGRSLEGMSVVLDVANGSAGGWANVVFERAGAKVHLIHDAPDGLNINAGCGATHPQSLQRAVVEHGADAGLAFDGDADRCIAVDHEGSVVDGDHIIAICARDRHERGLPGSDTVVVTVMANLGFRLAMEAAGVHVVETPVGDRFVLEALDSGGHLLGGEQSGHVIFRDLATTGDGLLTGLVLMDVVRRSGRPLAALAADAMERLPQVLVNVRVPKRDPGLVERLAPEIEAADARLAGQGRVLVRPSGTEPLVRVMVEARTEAEAKAVADALATAVGRLAGA